MKLFRASLVGITALAAAAFASVNPQLHQVKRVYILAMGSAMDQYLANQLTKAGIFEVVTDPMRADAVISDNVGESFQKKLDDLYPPPKPAAPAKAPEATKPAGDSANAADSAKSDSNAAAKNPFGDIDFSGGANRSGSVSRGKGNYFVVDRNSRIVLWSIYERPRNSSPSELTKTAERVVKHLREDLTDKKQAE